MGSTLEDAKTVGDPTTWDSRFFLKSEWGPISIQWPALSFSKRSVGDYLKAQYNPKQDFIVYAGTTDPKRTEDPEHRQRRLSLRITEPGEPIPTEQLVPWKSWQNALEKHNKNWPYSFGVKAAWNFCEPPWAHTITPAAYSALGDPRYCGGVTEIFEVNVKHYWTYASNGSIFRIASS
jgi:hypothetical protein